MIRAKVLRARPIRVGDLVAQHGHFRPRTYWPYSRAGVWFRTTHSAARWVAVGTARVIRCDDNGRVACVNLAPTRGPDDHGRWLDVVFGPIVHAGGADRRRWERAMRGGR